MSAALAAAAAALAVAVLLAAGCGSARRGPPFGGPGALEGQARRGQIVFARRCGPCHPGGEGGLGPSLNDKPLPEGLIRLQVRQGFGAMPAFGEDRLTEPELDDVVAYLRALR